MRKSIDDVVFCHECKTHEACAEQSKCALYGFISSAPWAKPAEHLTYLMESFSTVGDLIAILQKLPPDAKIFAGDMEFTDSVQPLGMLVYKQMHKQVMAEPRSVIISY